MIIPSIDLERGRAVQLVGGEAKALDAGDPLPIARQFSLAGEVAVVDLDAAKGEGRNDAVLTQLVGRHACRVGGGLRSAEAAIRCLDAGATKVVLGTMAVPAVLARLPPERVIAALDCRDGEVVVEGWRRHTGRGVLERVAELKGLVGGFLVTIVEREGRQGGTDFELARAVIVAAAPARVTIAGGITTAAEVAELDRLGADAQVGMALYTGRLGLADAIMAPLVSDRADGLWPTVVTDERGLALGLAYSSAESIRLAVARRMGIYQSRSRGLWVKGETSGATQELVRIDLDCDRDGPRFVVRQQPPGFCHLDTATCWGPATGLAKLAETLQHRALHPPEGSYTARLLGDPALLAAKLQEEAAELAQAATTDEVLWEAADVLFFTMARLAAAGASLADVERVLDARALKLTRRD